MQKPKFNVKLLRKIQKQILASPKQFSMTDWKTRTDCGTEMCIGGWACTLEHKRMKYGYTQDIASKALGLTRDESEILFFSTDWPKRFKNGYHKAWEAYSHPRMALWASKMIDWFIAQKEAGKEILTSRG